MRDPIVLGSYWVPSNVRNFHALAGSPVPTSRSAGANEGPRHRFWVGESQFGAVAPALSGP